MWTSFSHMNFLILNLQFGVNLWFGKALCYLYLLDRSRAGVVHCLAWVLVKEPGALTALAQLCCFSPPTQNITFPPLSCKMNQVGGLCRHYGGAGTQDVSLYELCPLSCSNRVCASPAHPVRRIIQRLQGLEPALEGSSGFPASREEGWNTDQQNHRFEIFLH